MKKLYAFILLMLTVAAPSYAALDVGDAAPNFTASAALGGKVYKFTLADSLAKGPVVLYFFPAAFSKTRASKTSFASSRRTTSTRSASSRCRPARASSRSPPTTPRT